MKEPKVALEVAEEMFQDFADAMGLDLNEAAMTEEDVQGFQSHKRRIVAAIQDGSLIFDDLGQPVFTPQRPGTQDKSPITFHERSGADLMAADAVKDKSLAKKLYAMMGSLCKVPPARFANMVGKDIKVCEALFAVLMG